MKKIIPFLKFFLFYFLLLFTSQLIIGVILSFEVPLKNVMAFICSYTFVIFIASKIRKIDIIHFFKPIDPRTFLITVGIAIVLNFIMRFEKIFLDDSFF